MSRDQVKRNYIRFSPDENTLILVKFADGNIKTGMAFSESHGGCGGMFRKCDSYKVEMTCKVQVGKLPISLARLAWIDSVDEYFDRLGFEYINESNDSID